jgi:hypothetical protein
VGSYATTGGIGKQRYLVVQLKPLALAFHVGLIQVVYCQGGKHGKKAARKLGKARSARLASRGAGVAGSDGRQQGQQGGHGQHTAAGAATESWD